MRSIRYKRWLLGLLPAAALSYGPVGSYLHDHHAPDSGFLPHPERMSGHSERFPFDRVWCSATGCDWSGFSEIFVAPVDTSHLLTMSWWQDLHTEPRNALQMERHNIALLLESTFEKAFNGDSSRRFRVVDAPTEASLILEMALVELVPTKAFLNAASEALGLLIPGSAALRAVAKGSLAIEGRLRHGGTGELMLIFADREFDSSSLVNVNDLSWHGHAPGIIGAWAEEFVELANTPVSHRVQRSIPFTLKIW